MSSGLMPSIVMHDAVQLLFIICYILKLDSYTRFISLKKVTTEIVLLQYLEKIIKNAVLFWLKMKKYTGDTEQTTKKQWSNQTKCDTLK